MRSFHLALAIIVLAGSTWGQATLAVPGTYPTIQAAIAACSSGDTILVAAGTTVEPNEPYYGNGNSAGPNIYQKNNLTIRGAGPGLSIIDLDGHYYGFIFSLNASDNLVEGFTLRNAGHITMTAYNNSHSNTIRNCVFEGNATLSNAWRSYYPGQLLINCTFIASGTGSAVYVLSDATEVRNCIFEGFGTYTNDQLLAPTSFSLLWNVGSPPTGTGILQADPLFFDQVGGDYHLQSTNGHWDGLAFTPDAADSPAIDVGDSADPVGLEVMPNGGTINLGAFGGTAEASLSSGCPGNLCGDCDQNGFINILDALLVARIDAGLAVAPAWGGQQFNDCNVQGSLHPDPVASISVLDALEIARRVAGLAILTCC